MSAIGIGISPIFGGYITPYIEKVKALGPIAYWPLSETSGTTADNAEGTAARDGTYTGVTLNNTTGPDGVNGAPLWDDVNDYVDVYSSSLNDAFDGGEGTIAIWIKVSALGIWQDDTPQFMFNIEANASNYLRFSNPSNVDDRISFLYNAGGTLVTVTKSNMTETAWLHIAMTWSASGDAMKAYYNGSQEGATQTSLGTWSGALLSTRCVIGAKDDTPTSPWDGWLAHAVLFDSALSADDIESLATAT